MKQYNRKSIRLKGYDYTPVGRYFVTIVTRDRLHLFGKIDDGKMLLNTFGEIAAKEWVNTINLRDNVSLGAFMIMPDHIHFVIHIEEQRIQKEYTAEELESEQEQLLENISVEVLDHSGFKVRNQNVLLSISEPVTKTILQTSTKTMKSHCLEDYH